MSVNLNIYPSLSYFGFAIPGDIRMGKSRNERDIHIIINLNPKKYSFKAAAKENILRVFAYIPIISTLGAIYILEQGEGVSTFLVRLKERSSEEGPNRYYAIRGFLALASLGALLIPVDLFFTVIYRPYASIHSN